MKDCRRVERDMKDCSREWGRDMKDCRRVGRGYEGLQ